MKILYIGDVMAEPGMRVVEQVLPELKKTKQIDVVIAQAENVSDGKSMLPADMQRLQRAGVDFFSGGNHTPRKAELHPLLEDPAQPVIGPANMHDCPGQGWKYFDTPKGKVLVISILGQTFAKDPPKYDNPLQAINKILEDNQTVERIATVVNFHGDYSSEKVIFGHYLDSRVGLVVGDHWHVPTADAMVLPKGTGYISDVGMCGTLHSSLGVSFDSVVPRWRDGIQTRNEIETEGTLQFNAVLADIDESTGHTTTIEQIRQICLAL